MIRPLFAVWIAMALALAAAGQMKLPPLVDVALAVRGPDGRPAIHAEATIEMMSDGSSPPPLPSPTSEWWKEQMAAIEAKSGRHPLAEIHGKTDGQGVVHFKARAGVYRMLVRVRGVGHGDIGSTELESGRAARPQMAPLVAYGSMDGTFPVEACPHDVVIHAVGGDIGEEISLPPDSPGHFHIADAPYGYWTIRVSAGKDDCAETMYSLVLQPGESLRDLRVQATPRPPQVVEIVDIPPHRDHSTVVWVRGTVRDESGQPVPGASVMALATYQGSLRMGEITSQAVADSEGRYELKGAGGLFSFSGTLVASAPGHPPAWAWPAFPQPSFDDEHPSDPPDPPTQDLVLPSRSGKLNVTVVRRGKPVEGISVVLHLENVTLRDIWARPEGDASAIQDIAYPVAKTNPEGVAAFSNLLPGRYHILATAEAQTVRNSLNGLNALRATTAESTGIAVQSGETTNYKMNIYEQRNTAKFRVMRLDKRPQTASADTAVGPIDAVQWNSGQDFDSSGLAETDFDHDGLWRVQVVYRDSPMCCFPVWEPYFLATVNLAASANLKDGNVPVFTARRYEPGSARIVARDANGKPLRVTVELSDPSWSRNFSGTTNEQGEVVFTGLASGRKYYARLLGTPQTHVQSIDQGKFIVRPAGAQPSAQYVDFFGAGSWRAPLPPPEEMRAEPAIMEQIFIARANTETRLLMRAVPLTYIYGVIRAPEGAARGQWRVWLDPPQQRRGARGRGSMAAGEYMAGPFPPGPVHLGFGTEPQHLYHATVTIGARQRGPLRFDFDVEKHASDVIDSAGPPMSGPDAVFRGMGGISSHAGGAPRLTGKVFFADGVTPALGAQALYFEAHQPAPALLAMTDALGNLQPRGLWRSGSEASAPTGPASPVVIAFLPGMCGATVQASPVPGEPLHLVLPTPITITGRVTVGGASPVNRPGVIHIIAASQGRGFLDPYISVQTTADADGNFALSGLTPGGYVVQAALDSIWLSSPTALSLTKDRPERIKLDIPRPGAPVRLELRDSSGKPVVGASITLERPGPMAALWPHEWVSDGAGRVSIPTLETGWQTVHVAGTPKPLHFKVPPLPGVPVVVPVTARQPKKPVGEAAPYEP